MGGPPACTGRRSAWTGGSEKKSQSRDTELTVCSDGKFGDAEGEVQVPHPVVGEAHRDHACSFQPVRHFQAADVQGAQPEALDERLHTCLGLRIIASDEDVGPALLQDMTEDGVERLHHAGAGRGRLGDFLRDRGVLAVGQPVGRGIEGVADVDDDLAREGVSVPGYGRNDTVEFPVPMMLMLLMRCPIYSVSTLSKRLTPPPYLDWCRCQPNEV